MFCCFAALPPNSRPTRTSSSTDRKKLVSLHFNLILQSNFWLTKMSADCKKFKKVVYKKKKMSDKNKISILAIGCATEVSSLFSCSSSVRLCQPWPCSRRLMIQDADCSRGFPHCLITANKLRLRGDCDRIALIGNQMGTLKQICNKRREWACKKSYSNWLSLCVRPARFRRRSSQSFGPRCHLENWTHSVWLGYYYFYSSHSESRVNILPAGFVPAGEMRQSGEDTLSQLAPSSSAGCLSRGRQRRGASGGGEGGVGWSICRCDARSWRASGRGSDRLARRKRRR